MLVYMVWEVSTGGRAVVRVSIPSAGVLLRVIRHVITRGTLPIDVAAQGLDRREGLAAVGGLGHGWRAQGEGSQGNIRTWGSWWWGAGGPVVGLGRRKLHHFDVTS